MNAPRINRGQTGYGDQLVESDDKVNVANVQQAAVARYHLLPGEEAASLPQISLDEQCTMTPLSRFLGASLTFSNPVWGSDPVPRMRALQKKLIEHSLTLEPDDRRECLNAITVVESDVQWRLRLQQMRMTDAEMNPDEEALNVVPPPRRRTVQQEEGTSNNQLEGELST